MIRQYPKTIRRAHRAGAIAALTTTLALIVVGCAGSDGSSAPNTEAKADPEGLSAAQAVIDDLTTRPTRISVDEPVGETIPEGKEIAYVHCGVAACNPWADATQAAAKALGWTAKIYFTEGTPEGVQAAWSQVVRDEPDGVLASGWDKAAFAQQLAALEDKSIPVVLGTVTDEPGEGIELVVNGAEDFASVGTAMAARAVVATGGQADVLYVNAPDYKILGPALDEFKASFAEYCATCELEVMDMPVTAVGNDSINRIISHLRSNPETTAVVNSISGLTLGLPGALSDAGLTDVTVIDNAPTPENMGYIRAGSQDSTLYMDAHETVWIMVDALARIFTDQPVLEGKMPGTWLLTQENMPEGEFTVIEDYEDQFLEMWGR